jgi:hypothetical protein
MVVNYSFHARVVDVAKGYVMLLPWLCECVVALPQQLVCVLDSCHGNRLAVVGFSLILRNWAVIWCDDVGSHNDNPIFFFSQKPFFLSISKVILATIFFL